jgi:CheY-like chemotaxis protein/anti-sigma regulatory factor (Ser/Thr protein kinase)
VVYVDSSIPNSLYGDAVRIRQVLLNLLSNAVKYTQKGFVSLSVYGELKGDNTVKLIIKVADSGRGIKENDISRLFDEFIQIEAEKNKGMEGTGLGLAITRNLVNVMGGSISATSEYNRGSTFTVMLPQAICKPDRLAYVENSHEKNVLIYERREICCDSIVRSMNDLNVNCLVVKTADEFYKRIISNEYTYVFVAHALFQSVKKMHSGFESKSKIVLVAEFGKTITEKNVVALYTPIYSIPVADILNGVVNRFSVDPNNEFVLRFVAPDARILIVDDINTNLKVAEGLMLPYEVKVDLCSDGEEAVQAVKSAYYDIVFMDHMMPEMDGVEATTLIREMGNDDPYYKDLPIVALTANAVSGMREMFLGNGFSDFLSKPIDVDRLNSILENWIPKEKQTKKDVSVFKEFYESKIIEIEGVDVKKGISTVGGRINSYLNTLSVYREDVTQKTKEIKACLEAENLPLYTTYVHALKSASANIGALPLSKTAEMLEMAGKRGDLAFIRTYSTQFLMDLETLLANIETAISEGSKKEQGNATDMELLRTGLSELESALDNLDSTMIKKAASKLRKLTQEIVTGVDETVENILKNVLTGEYDKASELIKSLLNK